MHAQSFFRVIDLVVIRRIRPSEISPLFFPFLRLIFFSLQLVFSNSSREYWDSEFRLSPLVTGTATPTTGIPGLRLNFFVNQLKPVYQTMPPKGGIGKYKRKKPTKDHKHTKTTRASQPDKRNTRSNNSNKAKSAKPTTIRNSLSNSRVEMHQWRWTTGPPAHRITVIRCTGWNLRVFAYICIFYERKKLYYM